ncbi:hypothetical protein PZB74_07705 [Porifericola rhodea]|uniref:hypothetical protein n=1 Tax=Porifericola rhodea TaxID=930972 RepID=UPI002666E1DD|nr:hypothetical protein [Porifericola rhodea]WKN33223.1 hypothetical protein PZB74_07705 [Porifericola rhodea]
MQETISTVHSIDKFQSSFQEFLEASELTRADKANKLLSQVDMLSLTFEGIAHLYTKIGALEEAGIFKDTPWNEPKRLVPTLVKGTLKSGHPNSSTELLSELRILGYARGEIQSSLISQEEAAAFLEEVLVHNLEFVFQEPTEETRINLSERELKKISLLFKFLLEHSRLEGIKEKLAEEITIICEQRPVVTRPAREIISLVKEKMDLSSDSESDRILKMYVDELYAPSAATREHQTTEAYEQFLKEASADMLARESYELGNAMRSHGLVSNFHASLLLHLVAQEQDDLVPAALKLNDTGEAEWYHHKKFVRKLFREVIHPYNAQCIYGFAKMLEKGLFSRQAVRAGLDNMRRMRLHSKTEEAIRQSIVQKHPQVNALQYLIGALIRILGQPLGVGQGNNPTCQSARGISMWSQHAPAKLINLVITAATQNNIVFRFEGKELESSLLGKGLVENLDYNLDAVSVILVPNLDKVYNEMMRLATGRTEDPHKWVNPALYGQWIQIGFASVYNYLLNAIHDFKGFQKVLYASCHPDYNGGQRLVYPNPVGIYITSSRGDMLGFHAVSLLRVRRDPQGAMRAYFLNPNNEGRQDWGQGIKPSVFGHGEKHGESSLPFYQFASRVYAFHYNSLETKNWIDKVPEDEVAKVEELARESWGRAYVWNETPKQW